MCAITLLRNGRHDIPTIVDPRRETRDVALPGLRDRLKVAKFEFRHAATGLLVEQRQRNTVVFENRDQILVNDRVIALAVAGCIQHNPCHECCPSAARLLPDNQPVIQSIVECIERFLKAVGM